MFRYKLSQIADDNKVTYKESKQACPRIQAMHLGQLKLFYSELMFLSKYAEPGDRVLYVGAASGYHTSKLAQLFPTITFDLWDPGEFDIESQPNITIYNRFFSDEDAEDYKSTPRLLFICDIRTVAFRDYVNAQDREGMDNLVTDDMDSQMRWARIMNPVFAYLKFRLPYDVASMPYLTGTIFFQPYAPLSTECRLLTSNYTDMIEYIPKDFDEKLAWHNVHDRCSERPSVQWEEICNRYRIKNIWDNTFALNTLKIYLKHTGKPSSDDDTANLFTEIIEYHRRRYGNKYMVVYQ